MLIHHDTHRFKQLKEIDILTRQAKDPTIVSVFECSHANKTGCPCKFVLREDQSGVVIGEHRQDAMHLNDVYSWRLFKAKLLIFDDLINDPFVSPQRLIDKVFNSPDFVVDQFTPSKSSLQNAVARLKAKVFGTMKVDVETLSDYLKGVRTSSNQYFTLYEETYTSDQQSPKRIVVFSSSFQLDIARRCKGTFMGDGTFDSVPSLFTQLYTIHALHGTASFPIAFALMEEKTTRAYEILFGVLKSNGVAVDTFMSDFERSARNAIRNVYGDVCLKGCWFHYTQSIMRRVKKVGLQKEYTTSSFVNTVVRRLFVLSFIPPIEVPQAVNLIEREITAFGCESIVMKLNALMCYFKKTWISKYPPNDWNQCVDISFRSNNWSESFNSAFSRRFARCHPNIHVMVDALKRVENEVHVLWNEFMMGRPTQTKTDEYTTELERLMKMREERWQGDVIGFVDAISRIPVMILLRYEKQQLEFLQKNANISQHPTFDLTERRLSEVTTLIEHDSPSLFEMRGTQIPDEHNIDVMEVITKRKLERRKRALREKIERLKNEAAVRLEECASRRESHRSQSDALHDIDMSDTQAVLTYQASDRYDTCETGQTQSRESDHHSHELGEMMPRRVRRRKSVITRMNEAIHRRSKRRL